MCIIKSNDFVLNEMRPFVSLSVRGTNGLLDLQVFQSGCGVLWVGTLRRNLQAWVRCWRSLEEGSAQEMIPRSQQAQPEAFQVQFNSMICAVLQSGGWDIVEPHSPPVNWTACLCLGYPLKIQALPLRGKCKMVDFLNIVKKFGSKWMFLFQALF